MKTTWRMLLTAGTVFLVYAVTVSAVSAQADPGELKKQACENIFALVMQCQLSADPATDNCSEVAGILSSPQNRDMIARQRPDGATDAMIDETLAMTGNMCRAACQRARQGKIYSTSREWMDDGGCTIEVK